MVKDLRAFLSQINFKTNTILYCIGLLLSNPALATLAEQRATLGELNSCAQFNNPISLFCTKNYLMAEAQQKSGFLQNLFQRNEAGGSANTSEDLNRVGAVGNEAKVTNQQVQQVCQEAAQKCLKQCDADARAIAQDPSQQQRFQQYAQISQKCQQEQKATMQRTGIALSEIATVLSSLAKVMKALGVGENKDVGLADLNQASDDPCEGQFADMLIECTGQSGPSSTRAGLNGSALTGGLGGSADGLFQSASQGEPGGDRDKGNKASTSGAGGGFAGAGMGMMGSGLGGIDSGSGGSSEQASGDINPEAQQGFMGTGGGAGGGGGGSSGSRSAPFTGFAKGNLSAEGQERAMIERKLNKLTSDSSARAPASADGTNGPFQDNWTVINKAYKKNAGSLFHQK